MKKLLILVAATMLASTSLSYADDINVSADGGWNAWTFVTAQGGIALSDSAALGTASVTAGSDGTDKDTLSLNASSNNSASSGCTDGDGCYSDGGGNSWGNSSGNVGDEKANVHAWGHNYSKSHTETEGGDGDTAASIGKGTSYGNASATNASSTVATATANGGGGGLTSSSASGNAFGGSSANGGGGGSAHTSN